MSTLTTFEMYAREPYAHLLERRWQTLDALGREGWHTTRHVFVCPARAQRGREGTYPLLPRGVEPVEVTSAIFEEWWRDAT